MKLSNLSLAVLVALGVAACGGSDDNNNAPQDPPAGNGGGNNGGGNTTPPPAVDNTKPQDPVRVAPSLTVEPQIADIVKARKIAYAENDIRDLLQGYAPNDGVVSQGRTPSDFGTDYVRGATDKADLKRLNSRVNYAETNQYHKNSGVRDGAVIAHPGFTYALGTDGNWYRMKPLAPNPAFNPNDPVGPGNQPFIDGNWNQTVAGTRYIPYEAAPANGWDVIFPGGSVGQDALFFVPNVRAPNTVTDAGSANNKPAGLNVITGAPENFDLGWGHVEFKTAKFLDKEYDISVAGKINAIDLNVIPVDKKEVQKHLVSLTYMVKDNKYTDNVYDDPTLEMTAKAGAMKAYNLPYSLAFVTVNQNGAEDKRFDAPNPRDRSAARNLFDYSSAGNNGNFGAYQVKGFQSTALPRNGRADYHGKSFGVDSIGDIHLRADFSTNGAHVEGVVTNRTRADGKLELPNIDLAGILLSAETGRNFTGTTAFGSATNKAGPGAVSSRSATGNWHVQFFGPNAEEAGGTIVMDGQSAGANSVIPGLREVFTSQRGALTDASNLAPTP